MPELSTLGSVIKPTYEGEADTNAFTDQDKDNLEFLMGATGFSGAYEDLTGKPNLFSGNYNDLSNKPTIPSGSYTDLTNKPALDFVPTTQKAAALGVATLDAAGKVPLSQLSISGLQFKGAWNPNTNTPALVDGTGTTGDFYKASAAGTYNTGNGSFTYVTGDWVIYAAGTWQRLGSADTVSMVNGKLGAVVLTAADVGALPSTYTPPAAPVQSVNGQTGAVVINPGDIGALPNTYTPPNQVKSWNDITNKPDFPNLYAPKSRGAMGAAIPAVLARLSANRSLTTGAYTAIIWNNALYDTFGIWNGTTGFVMPSWAKFIKITGSVRFGGNSTGDRAAGIRKNGSDVTGAAWDVAPAAGSGSTTRQILSGVIPVVSGDLFTMWAFQGSGGNLNMESGAAAQHTWVQIELYE